ncbi:Uncharacterized protein TPAR_07662 [Tolypocladium paradoxum]|uniref:DUF7924 domain-containing protein n=1 Tax=Tolypocladium paradoxum TaxID=94208 RepID=A0A2S4KPJ9_9HYPO|nr:Uncharacterized protein TPAR_07662 [Tolypocladium paradoxum]
MAPARTQEVADSASSGSLDHEPQRKTVHKGASPHPPDRGEDMPTIAEFASMLRDASTQTHLVPPGSPWHLYCDDAFEVAANRDFWRAEQEPAMYRILARKNSSRSTRHSVGHRAPGDTGLSVIKSLEVAGCFLFPLERGISAENALLCLNLLVRERPIPPASLFSDGIFDITRRKMGSWDKATMFRYITPLVVPSVEILAAAGSTRLECLVESIYEEWTNSSPLAGLPPRPDYSVGFHNAAFSDHQLVKLGPFVGRLAEQDQSFFMGTSNMYFPFLSCHVFRQGGAAHDAHHHTGHSMALAVRGVVELFRLLKREDEVNRQVLAFSVVHSCVVVQIYVHYAEVQGETTKYFRQELRSFNLEAGGGRDRWAAHSFIRNVYDVWMPMHLQKIHSAVDQLPTPHGDPVYGVVHPYEDDVDPTEDDVGPTGDDMDVDPPADQDDADWCDC